MIEVTYEPVPLPKISRPGAGRPPTDVVLAMLDCPVGMSFFWPYEMSTKRAAGYVRSAMKRLPGSKFRYRTVVENGVTGVRFLREV
jgi:hypothetical protein